MGPSGYTSVSRQASIPSRTSISRHTSIPRQASISRHASIPSHASISRHASILSHAKQSAYWLFAFTDESANSGSPACFSKEILLSFILHY